MRVDRRLPLVAAAPLLLLAACGGDSATNPNAPPPSVPVGAIRVTTTSSGEDLDLSAYLVKVGGDVRLIEWDDAVTYDNIGTGDWTVELQDVAEHCSVADGTTRQLTVTEGGTSRADFDVSCETLAPAEVDVTGTWSGDYEGGPAGTDPATGTMTLVLEQDGDAVTGSVKTVRSADGAVYEYEIDAGRVSGSTVTLFFLGYVMPDGYQHRMTTVATATAHAMSGQTEEQRHLWSGTFMITPQ